jgi:hypothetical protein
MDTMPYIDPPVPMMFNVEQLAAPTPAAFGASSPSRVESGLPQMRMWRPQPPPGTGTRVLTFGTIAPVTDSFTGNELPIGVRFQWRGSEDISAVLKAQMQQLDEQMQQLDDRTQAELRALSVKVEMLTRVVEASAHLGPAMGAEAASVQTASVTAHDLQVAQDTGTLVEFLNYIAEESPPTPPELIDTAQSALRNDDPALRAAAGRALSATASEVARRVLPMAIEAETNRFVAAVLRGAFRSANI